MKARLSRYYFILLTIKRNKLRSFLTSLGIIIGISAVIIIMSVGEGARSLVVNQINSVGSNLVGILPGGSDDDGPPAALFGINITTLVYDDTQAIRDQIPEVEAIAAYARGVGIVSWQNETKDTSFLGVTADYLIVEASAELASGRFISVEESEQIVRVAVLGYEVADELFKASDPIGQRIKIEKESFKVIGVMKERGVSGFQDQDNQIFIPLVTAQKIMLGINHLSFARAKIRDGSNIEQVISSVENVMRDRHDIGDPAEDDFTVRATAAALDTLDTIINALNYFLAAVASISLIVGGVGIMNIMLVSVSESTKEIGLRKAVGARQSDISEQFLLQTITITLAGGLVGVLWGVFISFIISLVALKLGYTWDFVISLNSILIASSFTIIVGLAFGWYPAKKAAALDPIDALRYE